MTAFSGNVTAAAPFSSVQLLRLPDFQCRDVGIQQRFRQPSQRAATPV